MIVAAVSLGAAPAPACAQPADQVESASYPSSPIERDLARLLPGRHETKAFVLHFRPDGPVPGRRDEVEERLAAAWAKVGKRLALAEPRPIDVFVYETGEEMARLTGRPAVEAAAFAGAVHVPIDRLRVGAALARAAEPAWALAGDKPGAALQGGRWYRWRLRVKGGKLAAALNDQPLSEVAVPARSGQLGFGVEEGRIGVRKLKVRTLKPGGDADQGGPWQEPLRGEDAAKLLRADVEGRFSIADGGFGPEIEGIRYGRFSRVRLAGAEWKDFELECEVRTSEGAWGEIAFGASAEGAVRLLFGPGAVFAAFPDKTRRQLTGPHPSLREGLEEAFAGEVDGVPKELYARAILDRGLAQDRILGAPGLPRSGGERRRRQHLLGAFVLFALDRFGPQKYRDLHFADLGAPRTPLGDLGELEVAWRKSLKEKMFGADDLRKADRFLGLDLDASAAKWRDYSSALKAGKLRTEGTGRFTPGAGGLDWAAGASPTQNQGRVFLSDPAPQKVAVRVVLKLGDASQARVALRARDGRTSAALLSPGGAKLIAPDGTVAALSDFPIEPGRAFEATLVLERGAGRLYVDGELAAQAKSGLVAGPGELGIEVEGRKVELREVKVRPVP